MNTLYNITNEYLDILNDCYSEEIVSDELYQKLEEIKESFKDKIQNTTLIIEKLKSDCELIKEEINRLSNKILIKSKNIKKLETYLKNNMALADITKVETPLYSVSIRKSVKTEVSNEFINWAKENKRENFISKKVTYLPDKKLIKEEIEKGNLKCPYARLVENQSLIIK